MRMSSVCAWNCGWSDGSTSTRHDVPAVCHVAENRIFALFGHSVVERASRSTSLSSTDVVQFIGFSVSVGVVVVSVVTQRATRSLPADVASTAAATSATVQ